MFLVVSVEGKGGLRKPPLPSDATAIKTKLVSITELHVLQNLPIFYRQSYDPKSCCSLILDARVMIRFRCCDNDAN